MSPPFATVLSMLNQVTSLPFILPSCGLDNIMIHTISGEAIVTILLRVYYIPLVENCCTGCSYTVICNVIIPIIKVLGLWCLIRVITKLPMISRFSTTRHAYENK
jgi:hypothetical protein